MLEYSARVPGANMSGAATRSLSRSAMRESNREIGADVRCGVSGVSGMSGI